MGKNIWEEVFDIRKSEIQLFEEFNKIMKLEYVLLNKGDMDKFERLGASKKGLMHKINLCEKRMKKIRQGNVQENMQDIPQELVDLESRLSKIIQENKVLEGKNIEILSKKMQDIKSEIGIFDTKKKIEKHFKAYKGAGQQKKGAGFFETKI